MPAHLSVVGRKNSGKTTLIEALIEALVERGFRVATVKHTSHDHDFDTPGKDSWRHRQAGSSAAVIMAPDRWVCHTDGLDAGVMDNLHQILFADADLVLWEGMGNPEAPRMEVVPAAKHPLHSGDPQLKAVVTEEDLSNGIESFRPDDVGRIVEWIIESYLTLVQ